MKRAILVAIALLGLTLTAAAQDAAPANLRGDARIGEQVRHELAMLIDYGVFDLLQYQVQGDTVVLSGAVRTANLRPDAEAAVKRIEGVEHVVNNIKVLSPSLFDDQVRLRVARAVFNAPGMLPYTMGASSPIRIIVEHGNVYLEGVVDSQYAKNVAGVYANQVAGSFSVTNNLRVGS